MENELENIETIEPTFNSLLNYISNEYKVDPDVYTNLLNQVAYHESDGTMSPTIKQYSGGPGRGKYQFEGKDGSNRILTAANRLKNLYKSKGSRVPNFVNKIIKRGTWDASTLNEEQQDMLILGDLYMKDGKNLLNKLAKREISNSDLWADHWWAGNKKLRNEKINLFNKHVESSPYNNTTFNKKQNFKLSNPTIKEKNIVEIDNTNVNVPSPKQQTITSTLSNRDIFKGDFTEFLDNYINDTSKDKKINEFNTGGTHEENPYGGIPQGTGSNGKMNTVEEGETSFELPQGKYIFSNRLGLDGFDNKSFNKISNSFHDGGKIDPPKKRKNNYIDERYQGLKTTDNINTNFKLEIPKEYSLQYQNELTRQARIKKHGEIRPYTPQSKLSKAKEIALNPMTAFSYTVKNQDIPDNFSRGKRNAFDYAIDVINPAQYIEDSKNVIEGTAKGNLKQVGTGLLGIAPLALEAKNVSKLFKPTDGIENYSYVKKSPKSQYANIKAEDYPHIKYMEKAIEDGNAFSRNWYNDPDTFKKLEKEAKRFEEAFGKDKVNPFKEIKNRIKLNFYESKASYNLKNSDHFGVSRIDPNTLVRTNDVSVENILKHKAVKQKDVQAKSTGIHEGAHGVTDGNQLIPEYYQKDMVKIFGKDTKVPKKPKDINKNNYDDYIKNPTEIHARIMETRAFFNLTPSQKISELEAKLMIAKIKKGHTPVNKRFGELISDPKQFAKVMNYLPMIAVGTISAYDKK